MFGWVTALFTQDTRAPPSDGPITQSARADVAAGVLLCCVEITNLMPLQWRIEETK